MKQFQTYVAVLCAVLVATPSTFGQQNPEVETRGPLGTDRTHWYSGVAQPYQSRVVPPVNLSNSSRIDALLRAGNLYLSLSDAIALALENNLDVEIERYEFSLAEADLLRAKSGAGINGIPTGVLPGIPTGAGLGLLGSTGTGIGAAGAGSPLGAGLSYDPFITSNLNFGHTTVPQSNTVISGTNALVTTNKTANFGLVQAFSTGGSVALAYNNITQEQNSFRSTVNPFTNSSLDLTVTQPLLQGFGLALNNRNIRVAKNNLKAADYVFRQQLINSVANVVQLYWSLVAANSTVNVNRQAVAVAQKLYDDNKKQVEIGTLAPIEVVRAEAQLATAQQALVAAQSAVLQLEAVLKSALSRNGLARPEILGAHVIPTDPIRIPETEAIQPVQDLVSRALENRPDIAQSRIQLDNAGIILTGTRNALLPTLSLVGDMRSNALIGSQNTVEGVSATTGLLQVPPIADPFFVGGYGGALAQLFGRNFPTYSIGLNLTIPLRNRAAQANMATASVNLRQNQLLLQRQINQIRVDVQNAITAVNQARTQYEAAVKGRVLQEQTLDADQKKLALGATTVYQVIQDQRDLTTAAAAEVTAQATYAGARVQLDVATGSTLASNNVEFDEAKAGHVSKAPSTPPAVAPNR
ncbi:MAG TPA: TolC family protein [Bryobacteraceae bacterium]|nr:TolC family protein [Bryobacteraceae bacterium]